MDCKQMKPLVPLYLDGELTEARAAPLRRHLLECPRCRSVAQGETALRGWFAVEAPVAVPVGFAARVARRAFAGDVAALDGAGPNPASTRHEPHEAPLMHFLLQATAVAAALLIALSIGMRRANVPEISDLQANDTESLTRLLNELDELNRQEPAAVPVAREAPEGEVDRKDAQGK